MDDGSLKNEIIRWNIRFPYDRRWRKKYNIAFNSPVHRESNFLDQLFDIREDEIFEEYSKKEVYTPNEGNWLNHRESEISFEEEIAEFDKMFSEE